MKYLSLVIIVIFLSCKSEDQSKITYEDPKFEFTASQAQEAKALMTTLCYVCHNPETSHDGRIAPPMIAIKMHYLKKTENRKDFINSVWNFVEKPTENKMLMKGAVNRFGLMPYQAFKEEDIKAIAAYIYDYEIEKPSWFDNHLNEEGMKGYKQKGKKMKLQERKGPKEKGMQIALATKKELGKNLMAAINEKGAPHAVEFCNIKAIPITKEKENEFNATIKRASDKPRNPDNKASAKEERYIEKFKTLVTSNDNIEAVVEKEGDSFHFYYPIITNDMCLKCHGEVNKEILPETYKNITLKYPEDLAIGYDVNQVRGIWHIEFHKE